MNSQKIKLGIFIDSYTVPAWAHNVIERIVKENSGEFALIILNGGESDCRRKNQDGIIYSIFNRIDEKIFTKKPNPFAPKNISELLSGKPVIKVFPLKENDGYVLKDADVESIKEYDLDILIKLGFEDLQVSSLKVSKYGTWFYYHGDDKISRAGPPGFWEAVNNWPETTSTLLAAGSRFSSNLVLFRSHFTTNPLSPARHRSCYFWATTPFMSRQISLLQRLGEEKYFQQTKKFNAIPLSEIKKQQSPSNPEILVSTAKLASHLAKEFAQRLFYLGQWFLLFSFEKDISSNLKDFVKLKPSKNKFWADPHIVQEGEKYYIFIEEYLNTKNKGHISVIEMDEHGNWKVPIKILEKDYHLSYPFVFEWNTKFYMIPESRANRTIDIYECTEFPYKWNFKQSLMKNVSAVDSTLIHYANKWWLFTGITENEAATPNVELFLFSSDNLFSGEWKAHPQNPIVSDVKSARPAGALFIKNGKLFRPSQDCSKMYGYGFDLNEIEVLTETEYRERKTLSIRPNWDKTILATHTYANHGKLTVIDAFTRILRFGNCRTHKT